MNPDLNPGPPGSRLVLNPLSYPAAPEGVLLTICPGIKHFQSIFLSLYKFVEDLENQGPKLPCQAIYNHPDSLVYRYNETPSNHSSLTEAKIFFKIKPIKKIVLLKWSVALILLLKISQSISNY